MTLDIDKIAINKKLRIIPDEPEEHPIPWLENNVPKAICKPHKKVKPIPGACIKTWTENGQKLFINVCHSDQIFPPEDISDSKFQQILSDPESSDGCFVIPMAIGNEKMVTNKENIELPTISILINTKYFEKCMKKPYFWQFTIMTMLDSIKDKYNKPINTAKYVILKNKIVMGSLDTFTIEDRKPKQPTIKKPLIEVLDSKETNKLQEKSKSLEKKNNKKNIADQLHAKHRNYIFFKLNNEESLLGLFYLPLSNITDITIDVGENRIIIENQKIETVIDTFLPYCIDNSSVTASFDSQLYILRLLLPIKKENTIQGMMVNNY